MPQYKFQYKKNKMKKILSGFLLCGMLGVSVPNVSAAVSSYTINQEDINNGYIVKKIWLAQYAMPKAIISEVTYVGNGPVSANTKLAPADSFTVTLGMECKRPFAVVRIPAYAVGPTSGSTNRVAAFKLDVLEQPVVKQPAAAAKTTSVSTSVLASGTWYKIGVTKTGFYKLDYNFIKSLGVDPANIKASDIRVFGNGGRMLPESNAVAHADDLLENAIMVNDGGDNVLNTSDYAVFYAEGPMGWVADYANQRFTHSKNIYSDTAYYFITFTRGAGLRISPQPAVGAANIAVNSFNYYDVHDVDLVNTPGIGKTWYGEQFYALGNTRQSFNFDFGTVVSNVYCTVSFGFADESSGNQINVAVNGQNVGTSSPSIPIGGSKVMDLHNDSWNVACNAPSANVEISLLATSNTSKGYLNYIELNTRRNLILTADQMNFRDLQSVGAGNIANYQLQGANGTTQVWDVANPQMPVVMNGTLSGSSYTFTQDAATLHEFAVMNSTNLFTPKYMSVVPNQNLHGSAQVDFIIVTNKEFIQQAEQLATYHRAHDNMRVIVATNEQVYNEFSSGAQDIGAIRDFARMFYKRAGADSTQMPRYMLLFGGASYDYKNRLPNNSNFVPVYESDEAQDNISGYSTDDFFGFLDDNEDIQNGLAINTLDIGIGRLPARSAADATNMVNKIIRYTSPAALGPWRISSTFVADDSDNAGDHMGDAEAMASVVGEAVKGLHNEQKVYLDAIPLVTTPAGARCPNGNAAINDRIFKGTFLVNFNGHGNPTALAHERILSKDDYNKWNNADMLPFMVTATCDFGQFDHPQFVSAAEQLLIRKDGGVIALLTTTAAVYSDYNKQLNTQYLNAQYARKSNGKWNTFGDASREGKNVTYVISPPNQGLIANCHKFSFLGDPALTPDFPEHFVALENIKDGTTLENTDTIRALGKYEVSGSVRDISGTLLSGFNGTVYVSLYDKARMITTITGANKTYKMRDNIVYKGKATVTNGQFTFTFIAPKDINYYYGTGKVSTYAHNGVTDGAGADTTLVVGGFSENPIENTVPPVVKAYINDSFFLNGGITGANTSLFVSLSSVTGINVSGNNLGHDLIAVLDGNVEQPYILNDYYETAPNTYQQGYVTFPINGLTDGRHSIRVKAWDANNNSGEGTVDFVVVNGKVMEIQNLMNYPNPFTNNTHFVFEHNHPEEILDVKINIYDISGKLAKSIRETFTPSGSRSNEITWDGTSDNGVQLPSGIYVYKLIISTENGFEATAYQKLVIVR
jgi:hypothetical protein